MASAVLQSRNEAHWGEHKVYMKNYAKPPSSFASSNDNSPHFNPNPTSRFNPNHIFNHGRQQIEEHAEKPLFQPTNEMPPSVVPPSMVEILRKPFPAKVHKGSFHKEYIHFDLSSYSKSGLKELKKRLISELDHVRALLNRIETQEIEYRPAFQASRVRAYNPVAQPEPPANKMVTGHRVSDFASEKIKQSTTKKVLARKRQDTNVVSTGRNAKRPAVLATRSEVSPVFKVVAVMMKKCKQILTKLMKTRGAYWFNEPVDVEGLKLFDYYQVIKDPMDLGTVKSRLDKDFYETPLAFSADVQLTFNNAMVYNPKGHDVHLEAEKLLTTFNQMFDPAFKKFEAEYKSVMANFADREQINVNQSRVPKPAPSFFPELRPITSNGDQVSAPPVLLRQVRSILPDPPAPEWLNSSGGEHAAAVIPMAMSGKLPKPKARDPNKRPMTYAEKAKLGVNLQELQPEKAEQMVHIIKKRNHHLMREADEIELDIESLDNETLWELERFVVYHKKAVSKMKKQELFKIASANYAAKLNKALVNEVLPDDGGQKSKKGDAVEDDDVDIGEEIPVGNFPPVEIEKDAAGASSRSSSSGSSSSSGDSSSSSDSGSSSSSDSEEDSVQSPFVEPKEPRGA